MIADVVTGHVVNISKNVEVEAEAEAEAEGLAAFRRHDDFWKLVAVSHGGF
jgi:hypothetical protein